MNLDEQWGTQQTDLSELKGPEDSEERKRPSFNFFVIITVLVVILLLTGGLVALGMKSGWWFAGQAPTPSASPLSSSLSEECKIITDCGGCGWKCVADDFDQSSLKCDAQGPRCELVPLPKHRVCGHVGGKCQFSHELFVQYEEAKKEALKTVLFDQQKAVSLCEQLHGNHLLDCYTAIAERLLPSDADKASQICDAALDKYFVGNRVENDCYYNLAKRVAINDADLAADYCAKASDIGSPNENSINNRTYCIRDISAIIARDSAVKAFGLCKIKGTNDPVDYCKSRVVIQLFKSTTDPVVLTNEILKPRLCKRANFSQDTSGYDYHGECLNLYSIIDAAMLAREGKVNKALKQCEGITNEHIHDTVGDCYKKVAVAMSENKSDEAQDVCRLIKNRSTQIECSQEIVR